jgi:hypothetical protein
MKILAFSFSALVTAIALADPAAAQQTLSISGTIGRCSTAGPSGIPLANVTVALTGTINATTITDDSGNYVFSGLPAGGSYTVTPSKARLAPGSHGIDNVDLMTALRYQWVRPPFPCLWDTADVDGINGFNNVDLIAFQRFILGLSTGIANVGAYHFSPVNRAYSPLISNETDQDYDTILFGDLAPPYAAP